MTASTITFTPEATMLPSTFSARKAVLLKSAKGMRMKPASVVSLNSISVTKSCTARMKKAISTSSHDTIRIAIWTKFAKKLVKPIIWTGRVEQWLAGVETDLGEMAGLQEGRRSRSSSRRPSGRGPTKLLKTMRARDC